MSTIGRGFSLIQASDAEFALFQQLLRETTGVELAAHKKCLLEGRLNKRLRALGLTSFGAYYQLVVSDPVEWQVMVDLVTTQETYFFREKNHFTFLRQTILPHHRHDRPFRVWCAACATGEEPYSVAMTLADVWGEDRQWSILATDISREALRIAKAGCYPLDSVRGLPDAMRLKFCQTIDQTWLVIAPEIRHRVEFQWINLIAPLPALGLFDLILIRNVMIYFDKTTKEQVVSRILPYLHPDGYLFVGHAESLFAHTDQLRMVQPTIYRRHHASR